MSRNKIEQASQAVSRIVPLDKQELSFKNDKKKRTEKIVASALITNSGFLFRN
jgi:hypothetical protein